MAWTALPNAILPVGKRKKTNQNKKGRIQYKLPKVEVTSKNVVESYSSVFIQTIWTMQIVQTADQIY